MNDQMLSLDTADLADCDSEPIHIPGSVQPHGALLALDRRELRIVHAGGDTGAVLGLPPAALLGESAARILSAEHMTVLRQTVVLAQPMMRPVLAFSMPGRRANPRMTTGIFDVIAHQSTGLLVLEFEPRHGQQPENALALVQAMMRSVQQAETAQAFCEAVATEVRAVVGFNRVMIYRFERDGSGKVVAEARGQGVASFLGLHYPASDIPRQARSLYRKSWLRVIPDARYAPAPIVPPVNPAEGLPLDLSQSVLRSVSPVHRQYLANMGVIASLSLSIIVRGELWGLIACHHDAPRYLPYRLREACALFVEMASSQLEMRIAADGFDARLRSKGIHDELLTRLSLEPDLAEGLIRFRPNLLDLIPAAGGGLWVDGGFTAIGATPSAGQVAALVLWLNATANEGVFATDCLSAHYPAAGEFADVASGILALSVSRMRRDYVLWFRPEMVRTVRWAGDPDKGGAASPPGERLTPRGSFAAWEQAVRRHAAPWLEVELEAAHWLRLSLLEVVLRRIDQIAHERETARVEQERLMRELDHRLEQWQAVAGALKQETERRAVVEAELSEVLRRTVTDQEAERLRIARELHDTLGQSLTLLQLGLDAIGQAAPPNPAIHQRLATLKTLAADTGKEVNRLAWEIRPTALDDLGIQTAIRNFMETWSERSGIHFDLHLTLDDRRLPSSVETTLYRVLQEALTNVVRHAKATTVGVILGLAEQRVTMIIEDNGRGFGWNEADPAGPPSRRLGLLGIRERLSLVGGSLEVESGHGKGATLFIRVPL